MVRSFRAAAPGESGFALVEILVVLVILGVLSGGGAMLYRHNMNDTYDALTKTDLKALADNIAAALGPDDARITGGSGASDDLVIEGVPIPARGAYIYVDAPARAFCLSKQSQSGRIWSVDSTRGVVFESSTWCPSATVPPPAGSNTQGATVSLQGNLLDPDQAVPALSGFVEYPDVDLEEGATINADGTADGDADGTADGDADGTVDGDADGTADLNGALEATVQTAAATSPATTVQPDEGACGNLEVVPGKIYHVEAFIESASSNSRAATVLMQYYDANNNIIGTSHGQWKQPGSKGIAQAESVAPEGAVKATCRPVYVEDPNPDDYYIFGQFGVWEGEGGEWAPPGKPIMEKEKKDK